MVPLGVRECPERRRCVGLHRVFEFTRRESQVRSRRETERNSNDKNRTLANSNQRARKGFEPTFTLKRDFGGLVGRYKLDWILVKPYIPRPRGERMSYQFAPHFPLTMRDLNNAVPDGISDHAPITVDLPLSDPAL